MATLGRSPGAAPLTSADIPDDSITAAKIVDDAIDSEHYTAGSVDAAHVAADVATQAELDAKEEFASGTKMIFNQTAAPTGWTKVTGSGNDTALRLTTGTVGTGGSVAFETAFASHTPSITMTNAAFTLLDTHLSSHTHGIRYAGPDSSTYRLTSGAYAGGVYYGSGETIGGDTAHTHVNSAASNAVNLDVSYVDVIIATKD